MSLAQLSPSLFLSFFYSDIVTKILFVISFFTINLLGRKLYFLTKYLTYCPAMMLLNSSSFLAIMSDTNIEYIGNKKKRRVIQIYDIRRLTLSPMGRHVRIRSPESISGRVQIFIFQLIK